MTDNMRMLVATGLVRRRTRAGDRSACYRIDDDAWEAAVRRRIDGMTAFEDITADGLALLDPDSERASRLHAAHAVYKWVGELFANSGPWREWRQRLARIGIDADVLSTPPFLSGVSPSQE